jgi:D-serine deaminase-like pyridoxal phosphate-dependent protein
MVRIVAAISTIARLAAVDAGHKSHAIDSGLPHVWGCHDLEFANACNEHGILHPRPPAASLPALGDAVWLVPGHCDATVNLHDRMIGVGGGLDRGWSSN